MSLIRKSVVTTAGRLTAVSIQVIGGMLVARWLLVKNMGSYDVITQFNIVAGTIASFGVGLAGIFLVKNERRPISEVTTTILWITATWCPLYALILCVVYLLCPGYFGALPLRVAAALAAASALQITANMLRPMLLAELRVRAVAVLDITQISAQTISTIVFALLGILSLNVALLTPLIGASTSIAVALWLVRHHIDLTIRPTRELITRLVSFGIRFATTSLAMIAHTSAAVLLMKFLIPGQLEQIGWYGRAASLAMMVGMISMGINPLLYASWADADATERRARQSEFATRLYMPLGILAACGVAALAPRILWLLYDDEFVPAAPFLRILAFSAALQLTANTLLNLFQAIGRPGIATMIMAVTLTANVSMSWFLIPRWGAYGSSCAMFASAVLWLTMTTLLARKYCGMRISNCFLPRWSDVVHVRNALLRRRPVPAAVSATPASDAPPPA